MPSTYPSHIVCTYLYIITKYGYPPPAADTIKHVEEMASLGFRSIELEGIRETHLPEMFQRRYEIKEALDRWHLQVPVYCAVLPGLSSTDDQVVRDQLALFELGCQTAHALGSTLILDNAPLPPYQFAGAIPVTRHYDNQVLSTAHLPSGFCWDGFWSRLVETFQKVCDIAARYDLTYLVHPAMGVLAATPESYLHFSHMVDRPNLAFNFDTANLISLRCNLSLALHQLRGHIRYVHVSDTPLNVNQHLPIGDGDIGWSAFWSTLRQIDYDGPIGIDVGGSESPITDLAGAYRHTAQAVIAGLSGT